MTETAPSPTDFADAPAIEVHYWPTPNGHKITMFLEDAGYPYTIKPLNIGAGDQFTPEFLAINPNAKMPAIVDPQGPGGAPIAVFESGAILQYLARKTGLFYADTARDRVEVDQWLFWQMAGLGPMAGQAHHFRVYAPKMEPNAERLAYGVERYTREVRRLYGVMNTRLADRAYLAGDYSIADMAAWPWTNSYKRQGQDMDEFPNLAAWRERIRARPAVQRAMAVGENLRTDLAADGPEAERARAVLFGQAPSATPSAPQASE